MHTGTGFFQVKLHQIFPKTLYRIIILLRIVIRDAPDTVLPDIRLAGYPANPKAGYQISGLIFRKGRISGRILGLTTIFLVP
jgi:hypothetical protein